MFIILHFHLHYIHIFVIYVQITHSNLENVLTQTSSSRSHKLTKASALPVAKYLIKIKINIQVHKHVGVPHKIMINHYKYIHKNTEFVFSNFQYQVNILTLHAAIFSPSLGIKLYAYTVSRMSMQCLLWL